MATGANSKAIVVAIDSTIDSTPAAAMDSLAAQGITTLDIVIANAGISNYYGPGTTTPIKEFRDHLEVNTVGVVVLFQAVWPLLQKSADPKFVAISSGLASIGDMETLPLASSAYGASKAALNYVMVKAHHENPSLTVFPMCPGWVQTEMGNAGAASMGMEEAPETLEGSVNGIMDKVCAYCFFLVR